MSTSRIPNPVLSSSPSSEEAKPGFRTKTIATRITPEELKEIEAAAEQAGKSLSEWARTTLLEAARGHRIDRGAEATLGEVLALRAVLLNLLYASNQGRSLTPDEMQTLIERADREKSERAERVLQEKRKP